MDEGRKYWLTLRIDGELGWTLDKLSRLLIAYEDLRAGTTDGQRAGFLDAAGFNAWEGE